MTSFERISEQSVRICINEKVFNERVITKTLYWFLENYLVFIDLLPENIREIVLEKKQNHISEEELHMLKIKFNQDLIDFRTRDIIIQETKNIRDILYVKAFADGDDFEDYNLLNDNNV